MAKFRPIHVKIWDDPDFMKYKPKAKLIFLFLCTNPLTRESGIYTMPLKRIAQCTGIKRTEVEGILKNNGIKNVMYDFENQVVFVCNFYRYHGGGNVGNVLKSIYTDYKYTNTFLWKEFQRRYEECFESMKRFCPDLSKAFIPKPQTGSEQHDTSSRVANDPSDAGVTTEPNDKTVKDMFAIFKRAYEGRFRNSCSINEAKDRGVAERLYRLCMEQDSKNARAVFVDKVDMLVNQYDVKHFSGLEAFWNSAVC